MYIIYHNFIHCPYYIYIPQVLIAAIPTRIFLGGVEHE